MICSFQMSAVLEHKKFLKVTCDLWFLGMKLLEIGFGFGSLANFLATKYDVQITAPWMVWGGLRSMPGFSYHSLG